jgi:hypothetical protein
MTGVKVGTRRDRTPSVPPPMPPYGYHWKARSATVFESDTERAEVVKLIFTEYANTTLSVRLLAQLLKDQNHRPPDQRGRGARGEWMPDTIAGILHNLAYAGLKYPDRQSRLLTGIRLIAAQGGRSSTRGPGAESEFDGQQAAAGPQGQESREYIFQGCWCSCGRNGVGTTYGIPYYHCRRDTADRCRTATHSTERIELRPWADVPFLKIRTATG